MGLFVVEMGNKIVYCRKRFSALWTARKRSRMASHSKELEETVEVNLKLRTCRQQLFGIQKSDTIFIPQHNINDCYVSHTKGIS